MSEKFDPLGRVTIGAPMATETQLHCLRIIRAHAELEDIFECGIAQIMGFKDTATRILLGGAGFDEKLKKFKILAFRNHPTITKSLENIFNNEDFTYSKQLRNV